MAWFHLDVLELCDGYWPLGCKEDGREGEGVRFLA